VKKSVSTETLKITINGEYREINAGVTVAAMLSHFGIVPGKVAVERNLEIVPRSQYDTVLVEDQDKYEVVHFIGGGRL
jgi:thiazole synthase